MFKKSRKRTVALLKRRQSHYNKVLRWALLTKQNLSLCWICFTNFQFIETTNLCRLKCACCHCNNRNIWSQDLHIKTLQAGFHHSSRLTGTFEEFELSIFVGEIELAKLLAEVNGLLRSMLVFLAQKKRPESKNKEYLGILTWIVTIKGIDSVQEVTLFELDACFKLVGKNTY